MNDLSSQIAELRIEVKWLKWIVPSACGLIALLFLIFWGIERKNIGDKVRSAIQEEGVRVALDSINRWMIEAENNSKFIAGQKDEALRIIQEIDKKSGYFLSQAEKNSKIIADKKDELLRIVQEISDNSVNIEKGAFGHWHSLSKKITTLGDYGLVKLKVRKGDIIEVNLTGLAVKSAFHYQIIETTGNAREIGSSANFMGYEDITIPINSIGLFRANSNSTLQFRVKFYQTIIMEGDVSSNISVGRLALIAKVIAK